MPRKKKTFETQVQDIVQAAFQTAGQLAAEQIVELVRHQAAASFGIATGDDIIASHVAGLIAKEKSTSTNRMGRDKGRTMKKKTSKKRRSKKKATKRKAKSSAPASRKRKVVKKAATKRPARKASSKKTTSSKNGSTSTFASIQSKVQAARAE